MPKIMVKDTHKVMMKVNVPSTTGNDNG